jgi:hypothetical protein
MALAAEAEHTKASIEYDPDLVWLASLLQQSQDLRVRETIFLHNE